MSYLCAHLFHISLKRLKFQNSYAANYTACKSEDYSAADKSLARPTSQCILFDGESILFDASLVIYSVYAKEWCGFKS